MFYQDLPITKSAEDLLNRSSFADNLAKTITQYTFPTSFAIGLYGAWGSGKTSLLNMVFESIEHTDDSIVILRFNPWLCTDHRQLINQFFKQLANAIKMKKPKAQKAWELIDQYADVFDAAELIPVAGTFISLAGRLLGKQARMRVNQQSVDLQESKNQIINRMKEEKLKIFVSIDDLDRLSEEEIIAVFQLVKSLADFPNTVYILAFDYDVVVRALCKVQHGDGKDYLEKIIQMPFEIPMPRSEDIYDQFFSKLNSILGAVPEERWAKETWFELFQFGVKKYIRSIRDVVRFTNVFLLKYELLKEETDPVDLLGLTSLQVFEPIVYSKLPRYKEALCGSGYFSLYSLDKQKHENQLKEVISALIPNDETVSDAEAAKSILGILFPSIKKAAGVLSGIERSYTRADSLINMNIALPECFDRYFALTLENDAIPTTTIKHMIFNATEDEFSQETMRLYQENKIIRLLEEIEAYANRADATGISGNRAPLIIRSLSRNWSFFNVDDRDSDFLSVPFPLRLVGCVYRLLRLIPSASRIHCIRSVFEDTTVQPSTLAYLLADFERQHGRFTEKKSSGREPVLALEEVIELETIFRARAVDAIKTGAALSHSKGLNFLWMLEQIDADCVARIKNEMITDDTSLVKVISYCTSYGSIISGLTKKTRKVNLQRLGEFIDVDKAYERMQGFIKTKQFLMLPQDDQVNVVAFVLEKAKLEKQIDHEVEPEYTISEDSITKTLKQLINVNEEPEKV